MRDVTRPPRGGQAPPARPLRLVHPAPQPDAARRRGRKRLHANDLFTPEEERRLRAALRNGRAKFGSWPRLCAAMGVQYQIVKNAVAGRARVSGAIAIRLSRALRVPLESLLQGPTAVPPAPATPGGTA